MKRSKLYKLIEKDESLNCNKKEQLNNRLFAALRKLKSYRKSLDLSTQGISQKNMVRWYAELIGEDIEESPDPLLWFYELYISNKDVIIKRSDSYFYSTQAWRKLRKQILDHYGRKCMCCGNLKTLVVDHIKPRSIFPLLELIFDNMQVLCNTCNILKSNKRFTDYRPTRNI